MHIEEANRRHWTAFQVQVEETHRTIQANFPLPTNVDFTLALV